MRMSSLPAEKLTVQICTTGNEKCGRIDVSCSSDTLIVLEGDSITTAMIAMNVPKMDNQATIMKNNGFNLSSSFKKKGNSAKRYPMISKSEYLIYVKNEHFPHDICRWDPVRYRLLALTC